MRNKSGVIANDPISVSSIERRIYSVRGVQVMIDLDLSELYGVENRVLRQAVRRNLEKFPDDFLFILSENESKELISNGVSHFVIPPGYNTGGAQMFAFTEQGVAMLATVLKSKTATEVSIAIMRAFIAMRRIRLSYSEVLYRINRLDNNLIETNLKIEELFKKFEDRSVMPKQGIFFDGQIFDAYTFASDLIKNAKNYIVLIDNYVDESVLTMLDKRSNGVKATIYTQKVSRQFQLDINRHNAQYVPIEVKEFNKAHDRFLFIDDQVYHLGASLKDLGKKWFAFSLMKDIRPEDLLSKIDGRNGAGT